MNLNGLEDLPAPGNRFDLDEIIGYGVFGTVWKAIDNKVHGKLVAIKIQTANDDTLPFVVEEYSVLGEHSKHPNLPYFYGGFRKAPREIWFVQEYCEGGTAISLSKAMLNEHRTMSEFHIAFIIKEVIKAVIYLHENNIIHRDIQGSNILLTKEGEVKLADFSLAKRLNEAMDKTNTTLGSPCWLAPEVVNSSESGYDNRIDVWALGITAIEIADGKAPLQDMHPTRALFHIVRNPPPTLYRPSNRSEEFNDFINECLVKNPEHRAFVVELIEHPFFEAVPENNYHVCQEIRLLLEKFTLNRPKPSEAKTDVIVKDNFLIRKSGEPEEMYVEDLAAIEHPTENTIFNTLKARMKRGQFQTFIGDVLLVLNPYESNGIYDTKVHKKYNCKSRSDNEPHVFAVADGAHQDGLHHGATQNIILSGESGAGKTVNFLHLLDHLLYLGANININSSRIKNAVHLIHSFTQASTPMNHSSTRCVFSVQLAFGRTGKISGAIFNVSQLEKWRVSSTDMLHGNFNVLYYFYDGMADVGKLSKYNLKDDRSYRYLRALKGQKYGDTRSSIKDNVIHYQKLLDTFKEFDFSEDDIETIHKILSAVLVLGDIRFQEDQSGKAIIENEECILTVAKLLGTDAKRLSWALTNYCFIENRQAFKKKHTSDEARDARDIIANSLYLRIVDYIVAVINEKLSYGITIFGHKYSVNILDSFGFECFKRNQLPQLLINTFNEQMHYHYLQRVFAFEVMEMEEEGVIYDPISYYNNKETLDELLGTQEGLFAIIDNISKAGGYSGEYINEHITHLQKNHIKKMTEREFSVRHYTGKVMYDSVEMIDRNRDFLPPELIETLRFSSNSIVKLLFTNKLNKTGNLLIFEEKNPKNPLSLFGNQRQEYSQIKRKRTSISVFKSMCIEILQRLSVSGNAEGTHFIKCIRSNLRDTPHTLHPELVKQQLRAMVIVETAKIRQNGYPCRISFGEFLKRYQFLAFGFDENVEVSKENCRLLFIRLQMEGWLIGRSKVLMTYYNEEYLARSYETQVKKVVKIQSMIRAFVTRKRMELQLKEKTANMIADGAEITEEEAAVILQKAYRGLAVRKQYAPLKSKDKVNKDTADFIRIYAMRWKKKSMFQVLLQYRAAKYQDLYNFSQQVHLYNQNAVYNLSQVQQEVHNTMVKDDASVSAWIGNVKPGVLKMPFRLHEIPYYDTSHMVDKNVSTVGEHEEPWDKPFVIKNTQCIPQAYNYRINQPYLNMPNMKNNFTNVNYTRDPNESIVLHSTEPSRCCSPTKSICKSPAPSPSPRHQVYNSNYPVKTNIATSKPANKDFEYIKPSPAKIKPANVANPIDELQKMGRRQSNDNEDEPPFNFQGMLRKTNYTRESLKRSVDTINFTRRDNQNIHQQPQFVRTNLKQPKINEKKFSGEVSPGVYMEGILVDL